MSAASNRAARSSANCTLCSQSRSTSTWTIIAAMDITCSRWFNRRHISASCPRATMIRVDANPCNCRDPFSTFLDRFEIGDDRPHVLRFEGELGHVRMSDEQTFRQGFCKSLDRIPARERSKRRCFRMRAQLRPCRWRGNARSSCSAGLRRASPARGSLVPTTRARRP